MPLYSMLEALECQSPHDEDEGPAIPEVLAESERPKQDITTTSVRKKSWVVVVGDSFLRGTEGLKRWMNAPLGKVCCLPGIQAQNNSRKLPSLTQLYDPLLVFHVGGSGAATSQSKGHPKRLQPLGLVGKGSGAHNFSPYPSSCWQKQEVRNRWTQPSSWLCGWCHCQNFGSFDNGMGYTAPGLLPSGKIHLSQKEKRLFAQEHGEVIDRALN